GSTSRARRRPAISPSYSATLLVATPIGSAARASTSPESGSRITTPNAAGPGFPRAPPSTSTISRRLSPPDKADSHARVGCTNQDPPALVAAQHLVRGRGGDL